MYNKATNEGIPLANVWLEVSTRGASTDLEVSYELTDLEPGLYNLEVSYLGFEKRSLARNIGNQWAACHYKFCPY